MRDPLESQRPQLLVDDETVDPENPLAVSKRVQAEVTRYRDRMRLLSLTRDGDRSWIGFDRIFELPWARPRMWEQYADNHAGVCLVFEREALLEAIREDVGRVGSYWDGPVEYTAGGLSRSDAARFKVPPMSDYDLADAVALHVTKQYRAFFFLKTMDWATEWEYRMVLEPAADGPTGQPHLAYFGDALRYVLVGERFPRWQLPGAVNAAEQAGVGLRRMSWEDGLPYPSVLR
jgi:Protein of unknown function (DUF2971)